MAERRSRRRARRRESRRSAAAAADGRRRASGPEHAAAARFDLLAVVAALALVGSRAGEPVPHRRTGAGRAAGRDRRRRGARPRGVLAGPGRGTSASWAGSPTARRSLLLVGVLAVGPVRERRHPVDRDRLLHLPAVRAGQARAAAGPRRRPRLEPAAPGSASRWPCCSRSCPSGSPCSSRTSAPRCCSPSSPGRCWSSGGCPARFLLPLAAAAVVSAPLMISLLRPYQLERLGSFLVGAHESPTGSGWALRQAHIAAGLRRAVRPDRRPAARPARAVPARAGHRPGAGQPGRAVGAGRRRRRRCSPRSSWCGGSRWPAGRPARRTARSSAAGLAILHGPRDRRLGRGQPRAAPAGRRPVPAAQLRRDGARRAPGRDRGRPGRPPGRRPEAAVGAAAVAQPAAAAGPAGRARPVGAAASPSGSTGGGCRARRARRSRSSGSEQMTRCIRLPAARGVDHRPARRAARRERRGRRQRRGPGARGARAAAQPGRRTSTALAAADRPAARRTCARSSARRRAPRCRWPVADVPRDVGDAVTAAAIPGVLVVPEPRRGVPAGRAARAGARLRRGGHARGREALARPAAGRDRRPRRARAAVRRGAPRDRRAPVPVRRPDGRAGRARRAAGPRARRRPAAVPRPGPAAAAGRRPGRGRARAAPAAGQDRRRRRDGPAVGAGPRHREHPVVRQQRLRAAGRRRRAAGRWPTRRVRRCSST